MAGLPRGLRKPAFDYLYLAVSIALHAAALTFLAGAMFVVDRAEQGAVV